MTSLPVNSLMFDFTGTAAVTVGKTKTGEFQEILNSQTGQKGDTGSEKFQQEQTKKLPGESLRGKDELRARTTKRELSRNVEERADIQTEDMQKIEEVLSCAVNQVIQEVEEVLHVTEEQIQEGMESLGIDQYDLLDSRNLSKLMMHLTQMTDLTELLTNEELYQSYQQLMESLDGILSSDAEELSVLVEVFAENKKALSDESAATQENISELVSDLPDQENNREQGKEMIEEDPGILEETQIMPKDETGTNENDEKDQLDHDAGSKLNHSESTKGRHREHEAVVNSIPEAIKYDSGLAQTEPVQMTNSPWNADTEKIMRQIMDYLKWNLKGDISSMEMQLHPASLGNIQIQVASRGGVLTANFVAQNETVKAVLESQMTLLKQQFEEQGMKVEHIEVTVQTNEFHERYQQERGNHSSGNGASKKGRARRVRIDGESPSLAPVEEETEAVLSGIDTNTVDYTA